MSKKITFNVEDIQEIIRLYTVEKMGTPSIGEAFKAHKTVINRTLRENGIALDQSGRRNIGGKAAANKRYYSKNKENIKDYYKEWSKDNKIELKKYSQEWNKNNREHVNEYKRKYERMRCATDPKYKLGRNTRTAVWTCLKERNVAKYRSTFETLGYTLEELMRHLENQFVEGMTWDNYGEWHVDHRIPMASFNFSSSDDNEFKLCWSLGNLQPLWGEENLSKGARYL